MSKKFNMFGDIVADDSERWFESDVVPGVFIGWLAKQEGDIEININSNGGSVVGGLAIANAIKGYKKGEVTCNVLGLAASMASVIACAGKTLKMGQGSFLMVHNPWKITMGSAEELRKEADVLDQMRDSLVTFYLSKSTKTAAEIIEMLDGETWISREHAEDFGFTVLDYAGDMKAAASLTRRGFSLAPDAARNFFDVRAKPVEGSAPSATVGEPVADTTADGEGASPDQSATSAEPVQPAQNWEARFKGLSTKYNDLQKRSVADMAALESAHKDALAAKDAEIINLRSQLETSAKDLADATAKVSTLSAELEERSAALQQAADDLAQSRNSLKAAEDKVQHLESTRDLLTAGVLTSAPEASYAAKMSAAKTPEEREALRAKKAAGKIK